MKAFFTFILIILTSNFCVAQNQSHSYTDIFGVNRLISDHGIVSEANPSRLFSLDTSFIFVGTFEFTIAANSEFPKEVSGENIAAGERIVFADIRNRTAHRLLIFQFEGFLPDYNFTYNYSFSGADSLGGIPYRNNVWFYDEASYIKENPSGVASQTRELIREKGVHYPAEIIMSRIVMVTNPERRNELIISYIETADFNALNLSDWERGIYTTEFKSEFNDRMKARAIRSIHIEHLDD